MTKEQKLTKWVQAGIDGGWVPKFLQVYDKHPASKGDEKPVTVGLFYAEQIHIKRGNLTTGFYIEQLILNKPFMRSVYGEDLVCEKCGKSWEEFKSSNQKWCDRGEYYNCADRVPTYLYHAHKALDIIYEGGDVIKYLCQSMEG
jgi:hypothetical protein